ncbi:hypothetical protein GCM10017712_18570 [Curtobacterium citreum]
MSPRHEIVDNETQGSLWIAARRAAMVDNATRKSRTLESVAGFGPVRVGSESRRLPRYGDALAGHIGRTYLIL